MGASAVLQRYKEIKEFFTFQQKLVWPNFIGMIILQLTTIYGFWYFINMSKIITTIWVYFLFNAASIGVSVGAHRLWTHKTYKAKTPLRIALMLCYNLSGQYSIVQWARDHRLHHKATDTDADPHNAKRGFVFAHCGWLTMKRHPEVKRVGKLIDVSDILADPVIQFQLKYFNILLVTIFMIFPSVVPLLWGETWETCIMYAFFFRYGFGMNVLWCLNSVGHFFGTKPYNKNILASQNSYLASMSLGEGWHNYHHVFPWDYKIGEFGTKFQLGGTIIKWFESIGQAYDLRQASPELLRKVIEKANTSDPIYEAVMPESTVKNNTEMADIKEKIT